MPNKKKNKIRVIELFAGVGGFRLGLERASDRYEVVWSNQWEPGTKVQSASDIYVRHFGDESHFNVDIKTISPFLESPAHLLVGGFPCQDYSVARGFKATGLEGNKGALWWEIHRILKEQPSPPDYLILENVDRLRAIPHDERGRDFAVVLASLSDLGYIVEWRVINSADYGMPQRRKRIYLVAYKQETELGRSYLEQENAFKWLSSDGVLANSFKSRVGPLKAFELYGAHDEIAADFQKNGLKIKANSIDLPRLSKIGKTESPFENAGLIVGRQIFTGRATADFSGESQTLGDIIERNGCIPKEYFIDPDDLPRWEALKGSKNILRLHKPSGNHYPYVEGAVTFPDPLDRPSRTIVTGEGGTAASRFKHVILHPANSKLRRLTPIELERLNMFPDNFTEGVSEKKRAFLMGNSVVVGVIENIGTELARRIV